MFYQHKWSKTQMATQLSSLKITNVVRQMTTNTNEFRKNKLLKKLDEQISLATAQKNGELFTVKRLKNVKDGNGNSTQIEVQKRVSPWFWSDNNKTYVQIRYGTRVLELQKGKSTIECAGPDDLLKTLGIVKTAVASGELDSMIDAASVKVRERFGR
ncbi:DUF6641 family protein [Rhodoferax sp. OV413]|uniref:DUF6641 family protein n=1 Tax=Rhodoferax sp. OV413 TaxID=1855285 RepID=UPI002600727A|nr:DUF6641 family protein [Rhodoferax sp. OV413]